MLLFAPDQHNEKATKTTYNRYPKIEFFRAAQSGCKMQYKINDGNWIDAPSSKFRSSIPLPNYNNTLYVREIETSSGTVYESGRALIDCAYYAQGSSPSIDSMSAGDRIYYSSFYKLLIALSHAYGYNGMEYPLSDYFNQSLSGSIITADNMIYNVLTYANLLWTSCGYEPCPFSSEDFSVNQGDIISINVYNCIHGAILAST